MKFRLDHPKQEPLNTDCVYKFEYLLNYSACSTKVRSVTWTVDLAKSSVKKVKAG